MLTAIAAGAPRKAMPQYQQPDSTLTLAEGLREYYASRDGLVSGRGISAAAREFFRCHDAAHVVFGCSTSLRDEAVVKLWSFFGTTAGLRLLRAYRLPEAQEIYARIGWREVLPTTLATLAVFPRLILGCVRLRRRWPWERFEDYLDVPLAEIRREYGIELVLR
jgi:ubiquinone biosynthesis protein Coq4